MDKKIALENLISIRNVLISLDCRYFLIDGTLLGLIRDNDFIRYDQDTDIGVFFDDFKEGKMQKLITELVELDFYCKDFGDYKDNLELSFERNGVKTDLFFYRPKEDKYIFHAFNGNDIIEYEYKKELLDDLVPTMFKGNSFMIPRHAEDVLTAKYGDWRVEDRHWDWAYSPKNIVNKHPVVFTCGCFDCLHEGHINLFKEMAKRVGLPGYNNPYFWVLIHDDYSILENKGRLPVQELAHRSRNLDILKITHSIEVNNADPTPEFKKFIADNPGQKLIYLRGDDWQDFPGRACLEEAGVKIEIIKYTDGVSTSLIRQKI